MRNLGIVTLCLLVLPGLTSANMLTNGDMENNATPKFGGIAGWGPNGGWAPHAEFVRPGNETLGTNFGFMSAGGTEIVGQRLSETFLPAVQYTFGGTAFPGGNTIGEIVFQIGYDDGGVFHLLASQAFNLDDVAAWTAVAGVSHTVEVGSPETGKPIWVRIGDGEPGAPGNDDVWFDNLVLVPEPGTLLLIGVAAAGLFRRR